MDKVIHCIFASAMLCVGAVGCNATESARARLKEPAIRAEDIKVTAEQVRLRMRSLVGPMCGQIETSADSIIAGTTDVNVKLAAVKWKMEAVPAMRQALYRPDPYLAVFDTGVLCNQMINYFDAGPGKAELGPASAQAAADCRSIAEEYRKVIAAGTISGDVSKWSAIVEKWATEHPIQHSISDRESALANFYEQEIAERTTTEYVAGAAAIADDLNRKMDVYSDQLFRQARWEAERIRLELMRDLQRDETFKSVNELLKSTQQAVATVNRLAPALERTLGLAQDAPKLVATERETVVKT